MCDGAFCGVEEVHDPLEVPLVDDPAKVFGVLRPVAQPLLEQRHHVRDESITLVLVAQNVIRGDAGLKVKDGKDKNTLTMVANFVEFTVLSLWLKCDKNLPAVRCFYDAR